MNKFNPIFVIYYQLYLLQLEEYSLVRFLVTIKNSHGLPQRPSRKKVTWTQKIVCLSLLASLFQIGSCYLIFLFFKQSLVFIISLLFFSYFYFLFLTLALILISPFDFLFKELIIFLAKLKIKKFQELKVIGIAGSYGKTTMKEILTTILSQEYQVLQTPKNINTALGIARLILEKLTPKTEIFLVEMGEYYPGDINKVCQLVKPNIGVITGINESHLERFKTIDKTIDTIFELAQNLLPSSTIILNADDQKVVENFKRYTSHLKVKFYSYQNNPLCPYQVKNVTFNPNQLSLSFNLVFNGKLINDFKIKILGEYIIGDIIAGIQIGKILGLTLEEIRQAILNLTPIEHRLYPIYNRNTQILVIDDSYNGNPDGVKTAISLLAVFDKSRKVYLTPGLVEMGRKTKEIHEEIGKSLSSVADLVILIKNSVTPIIERALLSSGFSQGKIIWFNSALEAYNNLGEILKPGDVILFQNDWPDNYF